MGDRAGQRLDNYQLVRLLGAGSFGEVYLAIHIHRKTQVAMKVLPQLADNDLPSFLNEARTIRLKHPHIVQVLDFGVDNRTPFIVMEYIPNGTLRQRYPKGTRLPLDRIAMYIGQVAQALQYAHDERIIHRDVKPENILLRSDTNVLLSDFGIATMARSTRSQSTQEMAGTIVYMAPEQVQGRPTLASDQYALGIIAYEWLCGERPFNGSPTEIAMQHILAPLPPLHDKIPTITPQIEQVVTTALAKEPNKRFSTVQEFAIALEKACKPAPIISSVPNFPTKPSVIPPPSPQQIHQSVPNIAFQSSVKQSFALPSEEQTSLRSPISFQSVLPKVRGTNSNNTGEKLRRSRLFYPVLILLIILVSSSIGSGIYYFLSSSSPGTPVDQSLQNTQSLITMANGVLVTNPTQALNDLASAQKKLHAIPSNALTDSQRQKVASLQGSLTHAVQTAIANYNQQSAITLLACSNTPPALNTGSTGVQQAHFMTIQAPNSPPVLYVLGADAQGKNGKVYQVSSNSLTLVTQIPLPTTAPQVIAMTGNGQQLLLLSSSVSSSPALQSYALSVYTPGQKNVNSSVAVNAQSGFTPMVVTASVSDVYVVVTSPSSTTVFVQDYKLASGKLNSKPTVETLTAANVVSVAAFPHQQLFFLLADGSVHSLQFTPGSGAFTSVFILHAIPAPLATGTVSADTFSVRTPVPVASPVSQHGSQPLSIGAGTTSSLVVSQIGTTTHLYVMDTDEHRLLDFTEDTTTPGSTQTTPPVSSGSAGTGLETAIVTNGNNDVTLNLLRQYISPSLFTQLMSMTAAPDGSAWYVLSQNSSSVLAMITLQTKAGSPDVCAA